MTLQTDRSLADVVQDILSNLQEIVRSEFRLVKAEARDDLSRVNRSAALFGAGVVIGLYAIGFLLLAIVYALETTLDPWQAALIVAAAVGATAVSLIVLGRKRMQRVSVGQTTIRTVKETVQWTKQQVR